MVDTAPGGKVITANVPAAATAVADDTLLFQAPYDCTVTAVEFVPEAAITGANTNYRTVSLVNKGQAGSSSVTVATLDFVSGVNATANNERALTLSATPANLILTAGDSLLWRSIVAGSGLADPGGIVKVTVSQNYA